LRVCGIWAGILSNCWRADAGTYVTTVLKDCMTRAGLGLGSGCGERLSQSLCCLLSVDPVIVLCTEGSSRRQQHCLLWVNNHQACMHARVSYVGMGTGAHCSTHCGRSVRWQVPVSVQPPESRCDVARSDLSASTYIQLLRK
jgi:hypothetical protein